MEYVLLHVNVQLYGDGTAAVRKSKHYTHTVMTKARHLRTQEILPDGETILHPPEVGVDGGGILHTQLGVHLVLLHAVNVQHSLRETRAHLLLLLQSQSLVGVHHLNPRDLWLRDILHGGFLLQSGNELLDFLVRDWGVCPGSILVAYFSQGIPSGSSGRFFALKRSLSVKSKSSRGLFSHLYNCPASSWNFISTDSGSHFLVVSREILDSNLCKL